MFRLTLPIAVIALVLLGAVGTWREPIAVAQEGTPIAATPESVATRLLASSYSLDLKASIAMRLVTLQPGASLFVAGDNPFVHLIYLGDGVVTFQVEEAVTVARAPVVQGTPRALEEIGADAESTLHPGESFLREPYQVVEFHNEETNPAILFFISVAQHEPLAPEAATPVP